MLPKTNNKLIGALGNPYFSAVRDGLTIGLPVVVLATFTFFLNTLPLDSYHSFMSHTFGVGWQHFGNILYNGTLGILSLVMLLSISQRLAEFHNFTNNFDYINPTFLSLASLGGLFCIIEPWSLSIAQENFGTYFSQWLSMQGVLFSILVTLAACAIFLFFAKKSFFKVPFYSGSAGPAISQTLNATLPFIATILFFALVKVIFLTLGLGDINTKIQSFMMVFFTNLSDDSLSTATYYVFMKQLLWFFGFHGSNMLEPALSDVIIQNMPPLAPSVAVPLYYSQVPAGYENIFTEHFFNCYTSIGGAGSTLGFIFACWLHHKDDATLRVTKLAFIPALFNINEILLFGIPILFNPIFVIPFLLTPVITLLIATGTMILDIIPLASFPISWETPILYNAYLATGSIKGTLLQLVSVACTVLLYYPFVSFDKKLKQQGFDYHFDRFISFVCNPESLDTRPKNLTRLGSPLNSIARNLIADMQIADYDKEFTLMYQPLVNSSTGKVYGVESLIRWHHPHIGLIPPPVLIGLAEETSLIHKIGLWTFEESIKQLSQWQKKGLTDIMMSVNISSLQLTVMDLPETMLSIAQKYTVPTSTIQLELTETLPLTPKMLEEQVLPRFSQYGFQIAIDDFGMGHTSITYLKKFQASSIKLDAMLTTDVLTSESSREIITSLVTLCHGLGITTLAEFVEDESHLLALRKLGCQNIQGYFYSSPLNADMCFKFALKEHTSYGELQIDPTRGCMI